MAFGIGMRVCPRREALRRDGKGEWRLDWTQGREGGWSNTYDISAINAAHPWQTRGVR